MKDYAVLTNDGKYTIFEFNNQRVRFVTSDKLERYTKVVEWDNGYLVMAKYKKMPVPKFNLRDWHFLIIQLQLISWQELH